MKITTTSGSNSLSTPLRRRIGPVLLALPATLALALIVPARAETPPPAMPFSGIGARATATYQGDALGITATPDGARLRCGFQKLEGHATPEGLWLESTAPGGGKLRVVAVAVGRREALAGSAKSACAGGTSENSPAFQRWDRCGQALSREATVEVVPRFGRPFGTSSVMPSNPALKRWAIVKSPSGTELPRTGEVSVEDKLVRFTRPGLTEEYSVSVDGVRQDFVIAAPPGGGGDLRVELALSGARAEAVAGGARLRLEGSGRTLAYSRLRVEDATGRELTARLEVLSADRLAVSVADASATYPVRIDPTFSDADWVSLNPGLPGADYFVDAIAADGSGNVYVGGGFTFIGTVPVNYIAKWDGSVWSALGSGMNERVYALAVSGPNLYAGGAFTTAGGRPVSYIAKWDGSAWWGLGEMGGGSFPSVSALAVSGSDLYAGGDFTTAGGVLASNIAKWNGSGWSALGSGIDSSVRALAVSGTNLYAGGYFTTAGGAAANYIAKWDGSAWSALGSGMNGSVGELAVSGTNLYAGGGFTTAGGVAANYIAKWDGSAWSGLASGMNSWVTALVVSETNLYVGGSFTTAGGVSANRIAKWDGRAWSALGSGMDDPVNPSQGRIYALAVSGRNLFAGGEFTTAGGVPANYVAKWDSSAWSALSSGRTGMNRPVWALALSGTDLYAGGHFTCAAGGVSANGVAKWDGSAWSALGSGMNGQVYAVAVSGTSLYAGGSFTTAGGVLASNIAKWDGNAWSALGSGMSGYDYVVVYALAVSGTNLYVGGQFTEAGGVWASNIAKWNGSAWSALGPGLNHRVYALAVSGANLYAGGWFTGTGWSLAKYIAKWDGSYWGELGSGVGYPVYALAVTGTNLYAGGAFTTAGGAPANYIAKWNGSAWSALGSGMGNDVFALAVSGTNLYAGAIHNGIAKWDGTAWSPLGSGIKGGHFIGYGGPCVYALAADGAGHLFVGGNFCLAGTNVSPCIAQANLNVQISVAGGRFGNLAYSPTTGFTYTFGEATAGQPYRIQTSASPATGSWADFTNFTYTGPIVITDPAASARTNRLYRAVSP